MSLLFAILLSPHPEIPTGWLGIKPQLTYLLTYLLTAKPNCLSGNLNQHIKYDQTNLQGSGKTKREKNVFRSLWQENVQNPNCAALLGACRMASLVASKEMFLTKVGLFSNSNWINSNRSKPSNSNSCKRENQSSKPPLTPSLLYPRNRPPCIADGLHAPRAPAINHCL